MGSSAVSSTIDVAIWFSEQARRENDYIQPQKLQRLLYLAQGSFAAMNYGRKLMPATFVADETGPIEPTIYRLFEAGPPKIPLRRMRPEIENFLSVIWRRYAHHTTEYLNQQIQNHPIYSRAIKRGLFEEIDYESIVRFFTGKDRPVIQTEQVKTEDGRTLQKWVPGAVATAKPANRE